MDTSQLVSRMIRAARLEPALYEEVEADTSANGQAVLVVVLSSLAAGIAGLFSGSVAGLVGGTLAALIGWVVWAAAIQLIGTRILPEPETRADLGQLLRTIGFSASPGVLRIFGFIPLLGWLLFLVSALWMMVAMVVAVRQALDYRSTGRAVAVCLLGWIGYLIVFWIFTTVFAFGLVL